MEKGQEQSTIDIDVLRKKDSPSSQDMDAIAEYERAQAIKEAELESMSPEDKAAKEKEEKEAKESHANEALINRAKEVGLEEGASEEEIIAKEKSAGKFKEKELSEEEKLSKEEEEVKAKEQFEQEVKDFVIENKVSEEEARKELEHISKVGEKYQNDPKKLAKTVLHLQRESVKVQEQLKNATKPKPIKAEDISIEAMVDLVEKGQITMKGKPMTKESILEQYRTAYPDITEDMADEKVMKLAAKELRDSFIKNDQTNRSKMSEAATKRRAELIEKISDDEKKYVPDIKPFLDNASDEEVLAEDYDLTDFLYHAKGKHLDKEKEEAYQRGYKKGLEEKKIIGQKKDTPKGGAPVRTDVNAKRISSMTDSDKKRAHEMFDGSPMTEEQMFLAYLDIEGQDKDKTKT